MITILLSLSLSSSPAEAGEPPWEALWSSEGWEELSVRESDVGPVKVLHKKVDVLDCLQGVAQSDVGIPYLVKVAYDVNSAVSWSSADLTASEILKREGDAIVFHQYLDVPDWTLVADRFWYLRASAEDVDGGGKRFRWRRVDGMTAFPDKTKVLVETNRAIEPPVNFGAWTFLPKEGGTQVIYRVCSDIGGAIPKWLQRAVATRTMPDTVADFVREAKRRATAAGTP